MSQRGIDVSQSRGKAPCRSHGVAEGISRSGLALFGGVSDNPFDSNATRVEWRGRKLGYVPAMENTAVAQMLDRGQTLHARITRLVSSRNPWERIRFEVEAA